jgi:DNA-binding IclR family transcriptional regulator
MRGPNEPEAKALAFGVGGTGTGSVANANVLRTGLRVIDALHMIAGARRPATLKEIAVHLGVSEATAFRVTETLIETGLVERSQEAGGGYVATMEVVALGSKVLNHFQLRQLVIPELTKIAEEFGESVTLAIPQGDHVVFIERITMDASVEFYCEIGKRLPLHVGAASRAILAFLPEDRFERYLSRPLSRLADGTLVTAESVRKDRDDIRALGYAVSVDDVDLGISGVAVPFLNGQTEPVGSAAIANLTARWSEADWRKRGERMHATAAAMTDKCFHLRVPGGGTF